MTTSTATHVIFDLGGTLVDAVDGIVNALDKTAQRFDKRYICDNKCLFAEIRSMPEFMTEVCVSLDLKIPSAEFVGMVCKELENNPAQLIPGVDRLVKHLYKHNIPMAIATNGSTKMKVSGQIVHLMPYFNEYMSHMVCGEDDPDVKHNKPAPDIYNACVKRFASPPESPNNCVIFEDSLTGITGAVASGMSTVFINDAIDNRFDEIMGKVTAITRNLVEFKPESVGLPAYD